MNEYELDRFCERNPHCDCNCIKCQAFAMYQRHELGYDDEDDIEDC